MQFEWQKVLVQPSISFTCGHCGKALASQKGYSGEAVDGSEHVAHIYICHFCSRPTFFDFNGAQTPGARYGGSVKDISDKSVEALYDEARDCVKVNACTGAVLCCRKLLMNIAVSKGAEEGKSFIEYVEYLAEKNYIPPDAKSWVDHIRKKGNEAAHEIAIMKREDAEQLISFIEMLLKIIYEFPAAIKPKKTPKASAIPVPPP